MKKTLAIILAIFSAVCLLLALLTGIRFPKLPALSQADDFTYMYDQGNSHLFDTESDTLEKLMNKADAVVLAQKQEAGTWMAGCLMTRLKIVKNVKGNLADGVVYYEPVTIGDGTMVGVLGYVPMQEGKTCLLFLQECGAPLSGRYYPLSADLGKYEQGRQAKLFTSSGQSLKYREIKDEPVYIDDGEYFHFTGAQRYEAYNHILQEITDRGLWQE